ncbi:MAG: hypothetical protein MUE72_13195 [Chitinophagaceae bacterium]|jgi:hypothetical protein|nr:hypothetical protein [Chitinophagaceae bacterium]
MKISLAIKISCLFFVLACTTVSAQKVIYSEPDKDDFKNSEFEIIGKMSGNFLVYKNYRESHVISVYDAQMKLVEKTPLNFLPERTFNAEFLAYPNYCYMFYQFQKRSIVYSMAVKLDNKGQKVGEPIELDTTDVNFMANNKLYSVINSENKQMIVSYKVNNKSDKTHIVTTVLFDKDLKLIKKSILNVTMPDRNDFLNNFSVDNDGDMIFLKAAGTSQNDNINKLTMYFKSKDADNFIFSEIKVGNIYLDDVSVKIDNYNKRFLVSSFFSKQRRGNIDGLFCHIWDKQKGAETVTNAALFADDFRNDAKGENSTKGAFNDYYIKSIISKQDGGFLVFAEAVYTSNRGGVNNSRWDYWGSPNWGGTGLGSGFYTYGNTWGNPWNRWNSFNNVTRYYADNIAIISYDSTAKVEWTNTIAKSQYDDNSDALLGYGVANTGEAIHILFNVQEKRNLILSDQFISAEGQVTRNPTLKNLDRGYDFMPKYAKQVGAKQIIVPCQYRNYICFAKIDFN